MDTPLINSINSIGDFKRIPDEKLNALAAEIRAFLVENVSKTGGHLASNLGVVELTIALHRIFDSPVDKLIFDVGHQSYVHKILTGRVQRFPTLRQKGGLSGFPKREESEHDAFDTGHSSTSISAALGMLRAKKLMGQKGRVAAVIGDGALSGGMAYEALNDAGQSELPLVVILNNNDMSIARSVGAISRHLYTIRASKGYIAFKQSIIDLVERLPNGGKSMHRRISNLKSRIKYLLLPNVLFEEMGFTYLGPVDGHDIGALMRVISRAENVGGPVLVHVCTVKGKGYSFAEDDPARFHGIGRFFPESGKTPAKSSCTNSKYAGAALCEAARGDDRVAVITAAMAGGTGMTEFQNEFPERFFDVGIAEQHAVTMAAGLAAGGMRPVVAVYSTFLQRAYDQMLHDVALQRLPVTFAVDRAGLVGDDGETHQGVYDIAYGLTIPNLDIYSPSTLHELNAMLKMAIGKGVPAIVRYSRERLPEGSARAVEYAAWQELAPIAPVTVIATGSMVSIAQKALEGMPGIGLVNALFIRPMDEELLARIATVARRVITIEDGVASVGFGAQIAARLSGAARVERIGVGCEPVAQASISEQMAQCGMDAGAIRAAIERAAEETK